MPKSSKSVKKGRSGLISGVKLKFAPRGKSFEKGNSIGVATRFVKGVSPNPGGRPSCKEFSKAARAILALDIDAPVQITTNAEAMAYKTFRMARKGNLSAIREVVDRCEGRPNVSLSFDDRPDALEAIAASLAIVSRSLGRPEGQEHDDDENESLLLNEGANADGR